MRPQDFELLAKHLRSSSGLVLTPEKTYLLESRLTPVARRQGLESLDDLAELVRTNPTASLMQEITEAMTTNESFFFRDVAPFENLEKYVLPMLRQKKASDRKIRIWCAASSTGQEPYSIAMLFKEQEALWRGWDVEILGTDISRDVLRKAKDGLYSQFEVQRGLPVRKMIKHFERVGDMWQLSDEIRKMVSFREFNLLRPYAILGQFDVIFCRNVLIYFSPEMKSDVLKRLRAILPSHGSLFLGAAETVIGISDRFKAVRGLRGLYVPTESLNEAMAEMKISA